MDAVQVLQLDLRGKSQKEVKAVAAACDVSYFTLRKIVSGETKNPGYLLVEKIRAYYSVVRPRQAGRGAAPERGRVRHA